MAQHLNWKNTIWLWKQLASAKHLLQKEEVRDLLLAFTWQGFSLIIMTQQHSISEQCYRIWDF
jgi:hypothetical protein